MNKTIVLKHQKILYPTKLPRKVKKRLFGTKDRPNPVWIRVVRILVNQKEQFKKLELVGKLNTSSLRADVVGSITKSLHPEFIHFSYNVGA